jgi:hypothetical protein
VDGAISTEPAIVKIVFCILLFSLDQRVAKRETSDVALCSRQIAIEGDDYYRARYHEAASKFLGQKFFRLDIDHPGSNGGVTRSNAHARVRFSRRDAMRPSCAGSFRPIEGVGNAGRQLRPEPRVQR